MKLKMMLVLTVVGIAASFFLWKVLNGIPAEITIGYTASADTVLKVSPTEAMKGSRAKNSFPVTLKKCDHPEKLVFHIPVSGLRFLFMDVPAKADFRIRTLQYRLFEMIEVLQEGKILRKIYRTDQYAAARYSDSGQQLIVTGADRTGVIRLKLANDLPRLMPLLISVLFFLLLEGLFSLLLIPKVHQCLFIPGKTPGVILTVLFFCCIWILPVAFTSKKSKGPEFSLLHLTTWPGRFSEWYRYHMPLRRQGFDLYHKLMNRIGAMPVKDVIIGEDSWLFSRKEEALLRERPYDDYLGVNLYTEKEKRIMLKNLLAFQEKLKQRKIRFYVFIAPNKHSIYPEKLPVKMRRKDPDGPNRTTLLVDYIRKNSDIPVIYPKEVLKQTSSRMKVPLYYRHDTHWNPLGAYVGAREFLKVLDPAYGAKLPPAEQMKLHPGIPHRGDLANMMQAPGSMVEKNVPTIREFQKQPEINDAYGYYVLPQTKKNGLRCFILRDSFMEGMLPYLNEYFSRCALYWAYQVNWSMIEAFHPDVVILETVERFTDRFLDLKETTEPLGRIEIP